MYKAVKECIGLEYPGLSLHREETWITNPVSIWKYGVSLNRPNDIAVSTYVENIEAVSDAKMLELANLQLSESQQETLNELLEKNSEGELTKLERKYLDELMDIHNDILLTKAKAMRIAVERGLMKPLSSE